MNITVEALREALATGLAVGPGGGRFVRVSALRGLPLPPSALVGIVVVDLGHGAEPALPLEVLEGIVVRGIATSIGRNPESATSIRYRALGALLQAARSGKG